MKHHTIAIFTAAMVLAGAGCATSSESTVKAAPEQKPAEAVKPAEAPKPMTEAEKKAAEKKAAAERQKAIGHIQNLRNQKKYDECIATARGLLADAGYTADQRYRLYELMCDAQQYQKKFAETAAICDEYVQKEAGSAVQKGRMTIRRVQNLNNQKKFADSMTILEAMMQDAATDPGLAVTAYQQYYHTMNGMRHKQLAQKMQEYGKMLLGKLEVKHKNNIWVQLLNSNRNNADIEALAAEALKDKELNNGTLLTAGEYFANKKIGKKDFAAAQKTINELGKLPKLNDYEQWKIANLQCNLYVAQRQRDKAVAVCKDFLTKNPKTGQKNNVLKRMKELYLAMSKVDEAVKLYDNPLAKASVLNEAGKGKEARSMALTVLADEKAKLQDRLNAYIFFCYPGGDAENYAVREKYRGLLEGQKFDLHRMNAGHIGGCLYGSLYYGNFRDAVQYFEIAKTHVTKPDDYKLNFMGVRAYAGCDAAKAVKLAEECAKNEKYTPEQRFTMTTIAAALNKTPDQFAAWFNGAAKEFDNKTKADVLIWAGRYSLLAGKDDMAERIEKVRDALYAPVQKKTMNVPFVSEKLASVNDWKSMKEQPVMQKLDRKYGGNLDFLVTDVATGNRGADAGATTAAQKPAEFATVCNADGVHMLFRVYDDKAPEVAAKLLGGGSFEMYLAPGINQPYICLLPDLSNGAPNIFQTSYPNESYQRLKTSNLDYKQEVVYNADSYELFITIPWDVYYNKLPDAGDVWEFEAFLWGRGQGGAWNGARSIHGRSDWGHLVFNLTDAQLTAIQKKLVFRALPRYKMEKLTNAKIHGSIDFWKDPVLGDPEFYEAKVKPLVEHLDSYIPLVKLDMSDADVKKVFLEAVPYWNAMRFKVDSLREKYMREKLSE